MLGLTIQNAGLTPARDIRFSVEQDVSWFTAHKEEGPGLGSLRIMRSGVGYLPPGRTLRFYAGRVEPDKIGGVLKLQVEYQNDEGTRFVDDIAIDTDIYHSVRFDTYRSPGYEISSAIRQLIPEIRSLKRKDVRASITAFEVCRFCGETIVATARKCPHCLEWVRPRALLARRRPPLRVARHQRRRGRRRGPGKTAPRRR